MEWQIEYEIDWKKKPEDHPAVDISVSMEDSVHWFCRDKRFRVLSVHPAKENPDAPERLFYRACSTPARTHYACLGGSELPAKHRSHTRQRQSCVFKYGNF